MTEKENIMETAKKFFEQALHTEQAAAILAGMEKPDTAEETYAAYAEIAEKLGMELSAEQIRAYLESRTTSTEQLDDEELEQVAGGGDNTACKYSYKDKQNCWNKDACDLIYHKYDDYTCKRNASGASSFYNWDM